MTAKEAISEIKHDVYRNTDNFEILISKEYYKAIIAALEKQIPKKPDMSGYSCDKDVNSIYLTYDTYDCPNCHTSHEIECEKYDHCPDCGQALDWSEDEND